MGLRKENMGTKSVKIPEQERNFMLKEIYQANAELMFAYRKGRFYDFLKKIEDYSIVKESDYLGNNGNRYTIKAKDIIEYLENNVTDDFFTLNMTEEELLNRYAYIEYLEPEEYTEEVVRKAIKKNYNIFLNMPESEQQKYKMILLDVYPQKSEGYTKEELLCGIRKNPEVFEHLGKEIVDKELLYCYLEQLVKTDYQSRNYYWSNISDELKDKVYHQSRAMIEPYYLRQVPKEYMSQKLINYSFTHMFDKGRSNYTKPLEILQADIEFLNDDMVLECCKNHFAGVEKIPAEYKNDTFYRKLMDAGMYEFICVVDLNTISKELIVECMQKMKTGQFHFWQNKMPKNFWTEELALEYARVSNMFYEHVPKKLITREMAVLNLKYHRSLEKMPKEYIDDEVIDIFL